MVLIAFYIIALISLMLFVIACMTADKHEKISERCFISAMIIFVAGGMASATVLLLF